MDLSVPTTPCKNWIGPYSGDYGQVVIRVNDVKVYKYVHRLTWEKANGPIPEGHEIHHTCFNTICHELGHLACITREEHRGIHVGPGASPREFCLVGHSMDDAYVFSMKSGKTKRRCRSCSRSYQEQRRRRLGIGPRKPRQPRIKPLVEEIKSMPATTSRELARRTGMNLAHASRLRNGKRVPSLALFSTIITEFGITGDELRLLWPLMAEAAKGDSRDEADAFGVWIRTVLFGESVAA